MKVYQVGGCVRDRLLGRTPKDIDYVVVGSTPEEMLALGFQQVGASFPVFLKDGSEYALARTERKTGVGYTGFTTSHDPSVTLEEDLRRRDLTINSMAWDEETNALIDPFLGQVDLEMKVLRHTSKAFAEDPVRVLRTARFAARYNFQIFADTQEMMAAVAHELDYVPQERIWAEIEKGLMERYPDNMFLWLKHCKVFDKCGALKPYASFDCVRLANAVDADLVTRFVFVSVNFTADDYAICRVPTEPAEVAQMFHSNFSSFEKYLSFNTSKCLDLLYKMRAFSGGSKTFLKCMEVLSHYPELEMQRSMLLADYNNAKNIDTAAIAAKHTSGTQIKEAIYFARLAEL